MKYTYSSSFKDGVDCCFLCSKSLWCTAVLRIRDVFQVPNPGSDFFPSRIRIKELKYFNPKKWFLSSRKYDPVCSFQIPDPDPDFSPFPDPGSRGPKGTGFRIRIRNTEFCTECILFPCLLTDKWKLPQNNLMFCFCYCFYIGDEYEIKKSVSVMI